MSRTSSASLLLGSLVRDLDEGSMVVDSDDRLKPIDLRGVGLLFTMGLLMWCYCGV